MIVAIDYGEKRCGYAFGKSIASEVGVVPSGDLLNFLKSLDLEIVVFGLPLSMSGRYSCQTFKVLEIAEKVKEKLDVEVRLVDERLSTRMAHEILKATKGSTPVDAVSASLILENYLKNPENSYEIPDSIPKIEIDRIEGNRILVHQIRDPGVLDFLIADEIDVLQKDPYIAYLFHKRTGRKIERYEDYLDGGYDIILTGEDADLGYLLSPEGNLIRVPVAQLDRAPDSGSGGRGFESRRARHR